MLYNPTYSEARRLAVFLQKKELTTFTFEQAKTFDSERRTEWILAHLRCLMAKGIVISLGDERFQIVKQVEPRKSKKGLSVPKKESEDSSCSFLSDPEVRGRVPSLCKAYEVWCQSNPGAVSSFGPTLGLAQLLGFSSVDKLMKFLEYCATKEMVFTKVGHGYAFLGDFVLYFEKCQRQALYS